MKFEVKTEVVLKFWREPPAYFNCFLIKIEGLYSKQVVPESEDVDVADGVGLEEVVDRGPVFVGLELSIGGQVSSDRKRDVVEWRLMFSCEIFSSD